MNKRKDESLNYPCAEQDNHPEVHGVLLCDQIEEYVDKYNMIDPFDPQNLKPAAYEVTVGDEYAIGGKIKELRARDGEIRIPPFQVVIVKIAERINLPRFLIARWNVRVKWAYEGLLWVGGPQIDPGWLGHLFCPLYNLSSEEVILKIGEPIAVIDFVKTTPFNEKSKAHQYGRPPKRKTLRDYNWWLQSALFTETAQRMTEVEKKVSIIEKLTGIIIPVIAVLFASLAILVTSLQKVNTTTSVWVYFSLGFSILAVLLAYTRSVRAKKAWTRLDTVIISYMIVSAVAIFLLVAKVL